MDITETELRDALADDLWGILSYQKGLSVGVANRMAILFETALLAMVQLKEEEILPAIEEEMVGAYLEAVDDMIDEANQVAPYLGDCLLDYLDASKIKAKPRSRVVEAAANLISRQQQYLQG